MSDYVIMPSADYQNICDAVREKTLNFIDLRSGDISEAIRSIPTGDDSGGGGGTDGTSLGDYISGTVENVKLPYGTTAIKNYGFFKDSVIKSVIIPETVTSIGVEAFRECTGLTSIEIPAFVTSVGYRAFWYDMGLETVVFLGTPDVIRNDAFLSSGVLDIYVPWAEGAVANAPWGAVNATIHYEAEV